MLCFYTIFDHVLYNCVYYYLKTGTLSISSLVFVEVSVDFVTKYGTGDYPTLGMSCE